MRQRRWIKLLSDYECEIKYHSGKANVVADALSRKERLKPRRSSAMSITIHYGLKTKILEARTKSFQGAQAPADMANEDRNTLLCNEMMVKFTSLIVAGFHQLVVVDRLTKTAHFLPIREDYKTEKLAKIYVNEIVARHGVPVSIILNCDGRFMSYLWQALQEALGTRLDMSTAYHPQTNGQSERTIQTLEDMLRACVMDFGGSWDTHLPLIEFSYNNIGDRVLLKVSPWKEVVRFGKKGKLAPRYVGPFEIVERVGPVAYRLKLPQELSCVHDMFHVSNLKKCLAEPDVQVPLDEIEIDENLRFIEEPIEIVERDVKKLKRRRIPLVKVRWNSRQGAEYTWEHEDQFRMKYPHLFSEPVPSSNVAT
ncbi:putative reverse transcriptase domain-containing protein [Tanacetum coccineum]